MACGWCVAQTLLLTKGPTSSTLASWRSANSMQFGTCQINTFKNNSCSLLEIHICWKSNVFFQSMFSLKRILTQAHAMTRRHQLLDLSTKLLMHFKTHDVIEKHMYASCTPNVIMHCAARSRVNKKHLKFMMQLKLSLRDLFKSSPSTVQESSALLRESCCWRFTPVASRRHVPRRFQILSVTLCHSST